MRPVKPASGRSPDAGFTLIEVVIAIGIIGAAMFTVLMATSSGVVYQGMARQRQTAGAVANQVMERLRALPLSDVKAGLNVTALTGDTNVAKCNEQGTIVYRFKSCTDSSVLGWTEPLVSFDCTNYIGTCPNPSPPLGSQNSGTYAANGITYMWKAYLTQRSGSLPGRFTVLVDWTWRGKPYATQLQSLAWAPNGCISGVTHFVSAPCGIGTGGQATVELIKVTVAPVTPSGVSAFSWSGGLVTGTYLEDGTVRYLSGSASLYEGDGRAQAVTIDSIGLKSAYSPPLQPSISSTPQIIAPSGAATYPRVEVRFASGGNAAAQVAAGASLAAATTDCQQVPLTPSFSPSTTPCMAVQSKGGNYPIEVVWAKSATQRYLLVRLGVGGGTSIWNAGYRLELQGGLPYARVRREYPQVLIGGCGGDAGSGDVGFSGCTGGGLAVAEITGLCDAAQRQFASGTTAGGALQDWGAGCSGTAHTGSLTSYAVSPEASNVNNTRCSSGGFTPTVASSGTFAPCAGSDTLSYMYRVTRDSGSLPGTLGAGASLQFTYEILKCTMSGGSARCLDAKRFGLNGSEISTVAKFTISLSFSALVVNPQAYEAW